MRKEYPLTSKFGVVPTLAILDKTITHAELRVFSLLCSYADKNGECYPSQKTLADQLGIAREGMNRHIKSLEKTGWIKSVQRFRDDGSKRSKLYKIVHDHMGSDAGHQEGGDTEHHINNTLPINTPPMTNTPDGDSRHEFIIDKQEAGMSEHLNEVDVDDVALWFAGYPRQQNRQKANSAYRLACRKTDAATLLRAAEAYAREMQGTDKTYIKRPENWLKEELWDDQAPAAMNKYSVYGGRVEMTAETALIVPGAIKLK